MVDATTKCHAPWESCKLVTHPDISDRRIGKRAFLLKTSTTGKARLKTKNKKQSICLWIRLETVILADKIRCEVLMVYFFKRIRKNLDGIHK